MEEQIMRMKKVLKMLRTWAVCEKTQ